MTVKICDRCRKEISPAAPSATVALFSDDAIHGSVAYPDLKIGESPCAAQYELCPACRAIFTDWITGDTPIETPAKT